MFYKKEENNYFYFKSDKDIFFFGPFENIYFKGFFLKEEINIGLKLKSYKNLVGIWNNNIYLFEYAKNGLKCKKKL